MKQIIGKFFIRLELVRKRLVIFLLDFFLYLFILVGSVLEFLHLYIKQIISIFYKIRVYDETIGNFFN